MTDGVFRILSIDGGGIRGIYPATLLQLLQERLRINPLDQFDLIAGTSTGAIIAAGLACGKSPVEIADLYRGKGTRIFQDKRNSFYPGRFKPGFHSLYERTQLDELLNEELGERTLGDITKPLIIPATDVSTGGVYVFKSRYSDEFTRDMDTRVKDAVAASCSAPTFFDPAKVGNYLLADGGVWANNPALIAIADAQYRLNTPLSQIRVLSLGTGQSDVAYGTSIKRNWGLLNGWKGSKEFINFLLTLQSQAINNYCRLMLQDTLLRLDFTTDNPLPLDDPNIIPDLVTKADKEFTYRSAAIRSFFAPDNDGNRHE